MSKICRGPYDDASHVSFSLDSRVEKISKVGVYQLHHGEKKETANIKTGGGLCDEKRHRCQEEGSYAGIFPP